MNGDDALISQVCKTAIFFFIDRELKSKDGMASNNPSFIQSFTKTFQLLSF
jgi:hypothetical protein